ncbi:MAG: DUF5679 domain-containing protein [Roseiflexaceae bacterium]|nr:DUF5679 domain-containing protein [Roseiflexaceae bacterium]
MPVPPGLLMDIAILVVREYWRSRRRRAAPAMARTPALPRAPARRLSLVERVLRLAAIAAALWLIWHEVTRRCAALIEARRAAVKRAAPMSAVPPEPSLPPAPAAPPASPLPAEPSSASKELTPSAPLVESTERPASNAASDSALMEHTAPDDASDGEETSDGALIGWCTRCRARHPMQQVTFEINAGGRSIARGICSVCGAGITRFVAHEHMERGNVER